jgi:Fe-S-cluster containining protein
VRVRIVSAEEEARVRTLARALDIEDPVADGRLRFVDGRCVFLDPTAGCRLHAGWGATAKPLICQQYPLVVVDTGSERRVGVDPGCYSAWANREAPPIAFEGAAVSRVDLDPAGARHEAAVLGILSAPGMTIARALGVFTATTGEDGGPATALPPGFPARWITRLRAARLDTPLARPETGAAVRDALAPALVALRALDPAAPPPWPVLADAEDAWAVEVARRLVGLRLCASFPVVQGVPLLALGGAVLLAWTDPRPAAFGRALAGWARALRAPMWWQALVPDPAALRELVGGGPGAAGTRP